MSVAYEAARAALAERLSPGALGHSERVARTAAELAEHYGADVAAARLAGLLHDWDRELGDEALLERAQQLGIEISPVDTAVPYLLHGPVAAADLAAAFPGIDPMVLEAVAAHTYGASGMSPVAMIVYIADSIEPHRTHGGVHELREAIGSVPLEELLMRTYAASLAHLIERRRRIHPRTLSTWNDLVARGSR